MAAEAVWGIGNLERSSDTVECRFRKEYDSCESLPVYREHEGERYCVLHLRTEDKKDDLKRALDEKLGIKDVNFAGAFFPTDTARLENRELVEADFSGTIFCGKICFSEAEFSGEVIYLSTVEFSSEVKTKLSGARFSGRYIYFSEAQFSGEVTDFQRAQFLVTSNKSRLNLVLRTKSERTPAA